jgi:DNA (cytosine-5)-methyltransferase 1
MISNPSILKIVDGLDRYISARKASEKPFLAALAMFAVYRLMTSRVRRYQQTQVTPLNFCHTGGVSLQILTKDGCCLETAYIIKGTILSLGIVKSLYQQIKQTCPQRCLVLSVHEPCPTDSQSWFLEQFQQNSDCEVMIDGVVPSLKYYLRLLDHPEGFLTEYRQCLEAEFQRSSGIKKEHLQTWHEIVSSLPNG